MGPITFKEQKQLSPVVIGNSPSAALAVVAASSGNVATSGKLPSDDDIDNLGSSWQTTASKLSSDVMNAVKASDIGETGDQLNKLIATAKEMDPSTLTAPKGMLQSIRKMFGGVSDNLAARHDSVEKRLDTLVAQYQNTQQLYKKRIQDLEHMYSTNEQIYNGLKADEQIAAAMLTEVEATIAAVGDVQDAFESQRVADLRRKATRLEQRIDRLKRGQLLAFNSAGQIRLMQENSRQLKDQFIEIINTTIPAWRQTLSLYVIQLEQQRGSDIAKVTQDATEAAMRKQADMLRQTSKQIAEQANRPNITLETLQYQHQQLLGSVDDIRQANEAGRQQRAAAAVALKELEQQMIQDFSTKS